MINWWIYPPTTRSWISTASKAGRCTMFLGTACTWAHCSSQVQVEPSATYVTFRPLGDEYNESLPLDVAIETNSFLAYGIGGSESNPQTPAFPPAWSFPGSWVQKRQVRRTHRTHRWSRRGILGPPGLLLQRGSSSRPVTRRKVLRGLRAALVHGSELSPDSPFPAAGHHSTLTLSGIPRPVIVLRILQARLTSARWFPERSAPHALTQDALVSEHGVLHQAPPAVA